MDFTETQWGCTFLLCGYVLFFVFAAFNNFRYAKPFASIEKPHFEDIQYMHIALGMTGKVFQYPHPMYVYSSYWDQYDCVSWRWMRSGDGRKKNTSGSHTNTQIAARKPTWVHTLSKPAEFISSSCGESKLFFPSFLSNVFFMQNLWTMLGESVHSKVLRVRKTQAAVTSCLTTCSFVLYSQIS